MHPKRVFEKIRKAFTPKAKRHKRKKAPKRTDSEVSGSSAAPPSSSLPDPNLPAYAPLPTHNVPKLPTLPNERSSHKHFRDEIVQRSEGRPPVWRNSNPDSFREVVAGAVPGRDDDDVSVDEDPYWLM